MTKRKSANLVAETDDAQNSFFILQARHYRQCSREARLVGLIWLVGLIYISSVIVTMGYVPVAERPEVPTLILGMPAWVFWGLWLPWLVQIAVTWWFAVCRLKDDEPYADFPTHDQPAHAVEAKRAAASPE